MEGNKIFVDSNFFIALYNPQDTLYQKAILKSKKMQKQDQMLVISNLIFLEIVTVLSQRVSKEIAIRLGRNLIEDNNVEIVHIDKKLNDLTWEIFQEVKNKNFSFVDASILAVMSDLGIEYLLTFDNEDFSDQRKEHHFHFY